MSLSFLKPSRCVLLIGDENLYVYDVSSRAARLLDTVPWQADGIEDNVAALIRKECTGRPVMIVNDMTDQHFKGGQRLPRVGPLDKNNVLKRKLQVSFPNYPIRGALSLKKSGAPDSKLSSESKAISSGLYLFAAVPTSEPVVKAMEIVKRSLGAVAGFYLLPVESADMVGELARRLAGKTRPVSRWCVFIGQHHNGALRQVITRDGQLAMTRMTPVVDTDSDHELWAQEVSQEFKATISYLSRFGFSPEDGTDVMVVCNPTAGQVLEKSIDIPCHYTSFTAPEAARLLGISVGSQDEPRFADPLHVAWIGRKTKFSLPMNAAELSRIHQPRQVSAAAILLLMLGAAGSSWFVFDQFQTMLSQKEDLRRQKEIFTAAETAYAEEVGKMTALGVDIRLVNSALKVFNEWEAGRPKVLDMLKRIDKALGEDLRIDALSMAYSPVENQGEAVAVEGESPAYPKVDLALKLSFPSSIEPEVGVREVNNLRRRLEAGFPGFSVTVQKNIAGQEFSEAATGTASRTAREIAAEKYAAELLIRGDVK